ncbi:amino acid adenylation domain-containing protein [Streptomyces sp. NPDC052301]|uniref:amino acid adenylation domain-containing protein n=1 Tax=Streptomyces sp. NPDC052301 TaxID=3365687 RepID=UPI0037D1E5B3
MNFDQRRALLASLLNQNSNRPETAAEPAGTAEGPLTGAQRGLWFLSRLEPDNPSYNVVLAWKLTGPVDRDALAAALEGLVTRHVALRTRFVESAGSPVQVTDPPGDPLVWTDLRSDPDPRAAALELLREEARTAIDLERGPVLRVRVVRTADTEQFLCLTVHHIVFDNWSAGLLTRDLTELYAAALDGRQPQLPPVQAHQIDVARRELDDDYQKLTDSQLDYWSQVLTEAPAGIELPRLERAAHGDLSAGATHTVRVPDPVVSAVRQRAGGTTYTVLLAAWSLLLHRYSRQTDLVIGSTSAGRGWAPAEQAVGYLQNTLALRLDLDGDPRFSELVARVRTTVLDAWAHQDVAFDEVVRVTGPARRDTAGSVFDVWFALSDEDSGPLELRGLATERLDVETGTAKYPLSLLVDREADGWRFTFEYATAVFAPQTVRSLAGHLVRLLEELAADGDPRLSEPHLLDAAERDELLVRRGWGAEPEREQVTVVDLFERQVRATPDAVAVRFGTEELSYAELNARANRLARRLGAAGVGPDVLVALYLERGIDMVLAVLATLKAGGGYVAVDPKNPVDRVRAVLAEVGPPVLLTLEHLKSRLPAVDVPVRALDGPEGLARLGADRPDDDTDLGIALTPENLCYVTYTSGSTGGPKGIVMPHRALVNLLAWQSEHYALGDGSPRTLQFASLAFDVSFQDMFSTWITGGEVVLISEDERFELAKLHAVLEQQKIERLFAPAPALQQIAAGYRGARALPATLKTVISGSEQFMATADLRRLADGAPGLRFHNEYGPSETHVVTCYDLPRASGDWPTSVPVGRPIANSRIYLLDERLEPVPDGVVGEIYIGGSGVARGYLKRPGITAERFLPDPFAARPGARMYRTGDLGRWRPTGDLEFLGRADFQVKVRGFRVELGEIEQVLELHPEVAEAVVLLREDRAGDQRLVGYASARTAAGATAALADELRALAKAKLPEYMVPASFVVLDSLPLTPNGKIDRRALPVPSARSEIRTEPVAPRTPAERLLAGIWAEVLGVPTVGVEDDFFRLGGHSLLATQVMARVRERFDADVPLRALFESPTVAGLAEVVEAFASGASGAAEGIGRGERPARLPLSFAQQRMWFMDQLVPDNSFFNIAETVRLTGRLDVTALQTALDEVVRRHEVLRTRYPSEDGEPYQEVLEDASVPMEHLVRHDEQEARALVAARLGRSFDLAEGPVLRAGLVELGDEEHVLWICVHHIAFDGWSVQLLLREISAAYAHAVSGRGPDPRPLPVQYADFAIWHRGWMDGEIRDGQLDYWRKQLAGAPEALSLPTDLPRPKRLSQQGAGLTLRLEPEVSEGLRELARSEGCTPFMVLLALFGVMLSRHGAGEDLPVATPIAGRTRKETEDMIGLFFNTLVLRLDLSDRPTFREVLRRTRNVALGAYEHQDLPFEQLVEALQPSRDLSRNPLAQVMFQLLNTGRRSDDLTLPGVTVTEFDGAPDTTHLDLEWYLREADDTFTGTIVYATDLFEHDTVARMIDDYGLLAAAAVRDPDGDPLAVAIAGPRAVAAQAGNGLPGGEPEPAAGAPGLSAAGAPDEVHEQMRKIWATVLKLDEVSLDDDFFDLGGQSLLATRLIARISDTFGVQLPLSELFERSTVGELADAVVELKRTGD